MSENQQFYRGSRIADVLGCDKKTVAARAKAEGWETRAQGNRFEYCPPPEIKVLIEGVAPVAEATDGTETTDEIRVKFTDLADDSPARANVLRRQEAVQSMHALLPLGKNTARRQVVAMMMTKYADFSISPRSLERWESDYAKFGIDGLVEQKRGIVGRKGVQVPEEFAARGKALIIEHGSVARAARELMTHPELPAAMREHLHAGHASKSHVTKSIRRAITPAALTAALAQGPRHARLSDRFTPGDYSDVKAGDVYVSDDMTSNVWCWCEWPNANKWRIGQVQILPVLDVGSLRWLNMRVIMRESGQYNGDDIAGLFGDVFDSFGLPRQGFVLEGGIWQGNKVVGHRTGLEDEARIGGLASLGVKVFRSYDPRSKIIETMFNQLQAAMDAFPGWSGRDARTEMPEKLKQQLALLRVKNPTHHPREFLPHISQLADHVRMAMEKLNQERNDGVILRGRCPLEKWMEESAGLAKLPDSAKWLYRSSMSMVPVTRNGVRVSRGTGKNDLVYWYDNPELLVPRQGMNVVVYWNDYNPDADAAIMAKDGAGRKFIGMAKRVQPPGRFSATDAELQSEAMRKKAAMHYARTELRSIQPDLARRANPVALDGAAEQIGAEIAEANGRALVEDAKKEDLNRLEKKVRRRALASGPEGDDEQDELMSEESARRPAAPAGGITEAELNQL